MSDKFLYQNAQIKSRESKLLTAQGIQRLLDADCVKSAMKTLVELGFGAGIASEDNFDEVFAHEEEQNVALLKEMNVAKALDAFLLEYDYVNLKVALKAFVSGNPHGSYLPNGIYDVEAIEQAVQSDGEGVDDALASVVRAISEKLSDGSVTAREIDVTADKAMFAHLLRAAEKSGSLAKEYFRKKIDYANISSFARCKRLALDEEVFKSGFIVGGFITEDVFYSSYDSSLDELATALKDTRYFAIVQKLAESGDLTAYEVAVDNDLLKMWKDDAFEMTSISPIVAYYLTKKTELKVAKLVVAGIKNRVSPQIIKERMRELYA